MKEIGIVLFSDAPNTETKIPILRPMAMNIPCRTKLIFELLVLIINSEMNPPITVKVHRRFANADTCKTFENLFNGVPRRERKSNIKVVEKMIAITGKLTKKSVTVCGVITKLISATFVIRLKIEIKKENFSEDGFMFVNNHLL